MSDRFHDALARLEQNQERHHRVLLALERRQSQIIGVLVEAGLWRVDAQTGRSLEPRAGQDAPVTPLAPSRPTTAAGGSVFGAREGLPCSELHSSGARCSRFAGHDGAHQGASPRPQGGTLEWSTERETSAGPGQGEGSKGRISPTRDPVVSKDPPRWKGRSYVGTRWSATSSEYMRATEAFLAWCFDRAEETGEKTSKGEPRAPFIWKDVLLARHWSVDLLTREEAAAKEQP